jgi:MFS family permease
MASSSAQLSVRLKPLVIGMVCTLLTGVAYGFGNYLFPMVMPEMLRDLGLNYTDAGIVTGAGQASPLFAIPLTGYLTHRLGGLRFIVCMQLFGAALLGLLSFVEGFAGLTMVIFLLRTWPIMVWIPLVAIAAEHIDYQRRATMITIASAGAGFFVFIDGNISSYFLEHHHWRDLWRTAALICFVNAIFCWASLKWINCWNNDPVRHAVRKSPLPELFIWLKTRSGITIVLIFGAIGFSIVPFQVYLAPYLRDDLSVGLKMTSLVWSIMGISGILGGVLMGIFTDRYGVKPALIIVFMMAALSSLMICLPITVWQLLTMATLFGIAQAVIFGLGPAYISKSLPAESAATANSAATMVLVSFALTANFIGGWSRGHLGSFWYFYGLLGVLFVGGLLLSLCIEKEGE